MNEQEWKEAYLGKFESEYKKALSPARGTGNTYRQMLLAGIGATFIWCNGDLSYPKRLAASMERTDLEIVSPQWLEDNKWRGRIFNAGIVVDHACRLTEKQYEILYLHIPIHGFRVQR